MKRADLIRDAIRRGAADAQLLDGRDHKPGRWNKAESALASLLAERDALAEENERLRERLGPDYHVYDQRVDGWSLKHPVACREEMLDCPVHIAVSALVEPPVAPGRYRACLDEGDLYFERARLETDVSRANG